MALRIEYNTSHITEAIYYAILEGAKIINMSFGSLNVEHLGRDSLIHQAVQFGTRKDVRAVSSEWPGQGDGACARASDPGFDVRKETSEPGNCKKTNPSGSEFRRLARSDPVSQSYAIVPGHQKIFLN